jgi:hypothetical protein
MWAAQVSHPWAYEIASKITELNILICRVSDRRRNGGGNIRTVLSLWLQVSLPQKQVISNLEPQR